MHSFDTLSRYLLPVEIQEEKKGQQVVGNSFPHLWI